MRDRHAWHPLPASPTQGEGKTRDHGPPARHKTHNKAPAGRKPAKLHTLAAVSSRVKGAAARSEQAARARLPLRRPRGDPYSVRVRVELREARGHVLIIRLVVALLAASERSARGRQRLLLLARSARARRACSCSSSLCNSVSRGRGGAAWRCTTLRGAPCVPRVLC